MLPQGMFSVAVATVLFPTLARLATRGDLAGVRNTVSLGVRQINFLLVPAAAVSIVLAEPIVRLLYQRGAFEPGQTTVVAGALAAFSVGLSFNGMMLMLNRGFFSLQQPWIPTGDRTGEPRPQRRALRGLLPRRHVGDPARDLALEHRRRRDAARRAAAPRSARSTLRATVRSFGLVTVASALLAASRATPSGAGSTRRSAAPSSRSSSRSAGRSSPAAPSTWRLPCAPGSRAGDATLVARPLPPRLITHGPGPDPQLLDHRPHRPWEVDAGRSDPGGDGHRRRPRDAGAAARLDGSRARARDHDQGAGRARALEGPPAQPDRHARATSTSRTRSRARCRPARARCSSSTRRRGSRRRRSRTPTSRSRTTSRSSRS